MQEIYRPVSGHTKLQKAANLQVDKLKSSHIELCHLFGWMKFGKCIRVNYCSEMKVDTGLHILKGCLCNYFMPNCKRNYLFPHDSLSKRLLDDTNYFLYAL